jgi:hypothetical protein
MAPALAYFGMSAGDRRDKFTLADSRGQWRCAGIVPNRKLDRRQCGNSGATICQHRASARAGTVGNREHVRRPRARHAGRLAVSDSPLLGLLTFVTRDDHYDFMIDEQMANAIVQEVRTFLRGDSPQLPEEDE